MVIILRNARSVRRCGNHLKKAITEMSDLSRMKISGGELSGREGWNEPLIGSLFFFYEIATPACSVATNHCDNNLVPNVTRNNKAAMIANICSANKKERERKRGLYNTL